MTAVNPERGEVGILLEGRELPMRPSFEAMQAIESELGPILGLSNRLQSPTAMLTLQEISVIVCQCIRAAGRERDDKMLAAVKLERIRELVFKEGIQYVIGPLSRLFYNMLTGGGEAKKKPPEDPADHPSDSPTES